LPEKVSTPPIPSLSAHDASGSFFGRADDLIFFRSGFSLIKVATTSEAIIDDDVRANSSAVVRDGDVSVVSPFIRKDWNAAVRYQRKRLRHPVWKRDLTDQHRLGPPAL